MSSNLANRRVYFKPLLLMSLWRGRENEREGGEERESEEGKKLPERKNDGRGKLSRYTETAEWPELANRHSRDSLTEMLRLKRRGGGGDLLRVGGGGWGIGELLRE